MEGVYEYLATTYVQAYPATPPLLLLLHFGVEVLALGFEAYHAGVLLYHDIHAPREELGLPVYHEVQELLILGADKLE